MNEQFEQTRNMVNWVFRINSCLAAGVFGLVLLVFLVGAAAACWGGIYYSSGFRDGHVQKLSDRGLFWVLCEGELAPVGMTTGRAQRNQPAGPAVFDFTVADPEVREQLEQAGPQTMVRLYYRQYIFSPPWKSSTGYFITKVEKVDNAQK